LLELIMRPILAITKALSDGTRLRALLALQSGELCLCQLVELLELAPSTVSRHLNILQEARLIDRRKDGRWAYFRLADEPSPEAASALEWVLGSLESDPAVVRDQVQLKRITACDPSELCACYN
jgi:ArsR family transcriptional regulator